MTTLSKRQPPPRPVTGEPIERRLLFSSEISFAGAQALSLTGAAGPIYAGLFSGSENPTDLAVSTGSAVQILLGSGNGSFTPGQSISFPANPAPGKPFLAGDFTDNGTSDIVLLSQSSITGDGLITFESGTGNGTFITGAASTIDNGGAGFQPITAAVGDFNGDGSADLAVLGKPVTGSGLVLAIMLSDSDGTFTESADYPVTDAATTGTPLDEPLIAGNFAGSDIDLALDDGSSGHLDLFLNNGNGTFDAQPPVPLSATLMVSTQLTSSGHLDLLTASGQSVTPLLGNGDGTFTTAAPVTLPQTVTALAAADLNLDGNKDIVTNAGILTGNGDGTFSNSVTPLPVSLDGGGTVSNTLLAADVTGDGRPDVVGFSSTGNGLVTLVNTTAAATATSVTSSAEPANPGEDVKLIATVSTGLSTPTPTGSVLFYDGTTLLGSAAIGTGSKATFDAGSGLSLGSHPIMAVYAGDSAFAGSNSAVYTQTVLAPTVTALTTSENPTDVGDPITLTATVTGNDGQGDTPTGGVEFLEGSTPLGDVDVNDNGVATLSDFSLTSGAAQLLTAVYQGDDVFAGSTSAAISETVNSAPLLPVVSKSTLPATVVVGTAIRRGSARVTLTNQTAELISGAVEIALFVSPSGYIDATATGLNTVLHTVRLKAGASTAITIPLTSLPGTLASGSYNLLARASFGSGALSTSNTGYGTQGPAIAIDTPAPALSATVRTRGLAASLVAGTATRAVAVVTLTNTGNVPVAGPVTIALSFSGTTAAVGTSVTTLRRTVSIKVGASIAVTVPLAKLPVLAGGMYYLTASITEPAISAVIASTAGAYVLAAPYVDLQLSIGAVRGSSKSNSVDTITFLLSNTGNIPTTGMADFTVAALPVAGGNQTVLANVWALSVVSAGGHRSFALRFTIPSALAPGEYFPVVSVNLDGATASTQGTTPIVAT